MSYYIIDTENEESLKNLKLENLNISCHFPLYSHI